MLWQLSDEVQCIRIPTTDKQDFRLPDLDILREHHQNKFSLSSAVVRALASLKLRLRFSVRIFSMLLRAVRRRAGGRRSAGAPAVFAWPEPEPEFGCDFPAPAGTSK